jgi:hypothetical protein
MPGTSIQALRLAKLTEIIAVGRSAFLTCSW